MKLLSLIPLYILVTVYAPIELTRIILSYIEHGYAEEFRIGLLHWEIIMIWGGYIVGLLLFVYWIKRAVKQ